MLKQEKEREFDQTWFFVLLVDQVVDPEYHHSERKKKEKDHLPFLP